MLLQVKKNTLRPNQESGFTLVEIAVSLIIIGLLITPLFSLYQQYITEKRLNETQSNIRDVVTMMEEHRTIHGFYPCPAPMNAARTDTDHGRSCGTPGSFAALPHVAGECQDGICIKASPRGVSDVIVGAVPFRNLQMMEQDTLDGYGNRLMYAVTSDLTDITTFDTTAGGISIKDTGNNEITGNQDAMFLVLSYGPSKEGAYSNNGTLKRACSTTSTIETNNCIPDFGGGTAVTLTQTNAIFSYAPITTAENADTFDHVLQFHSTEEQALWRRYNNTAANIVHAQDLSQNRSIAIGTDLPTPDVELEIQTEEHSTGNNVASLKINSGNIITDEVCDESGTYCFQPNLLAGDVDAATGGMRCANSDEYMVGIENGQPVCRELEIKCPDATPVFLGVNTDGTPNCDVVPGNSCLASTETVCTANDSLLPFGGDGAIINKTAGLENCAEAEFTCSDGTWTKTDTSNVTTARCNFVATSTPSAPISCGPEELYGDQTYTITTHTHCNAPDTTTRTNCICGKDENGVSIPNGFAYKKCSDHNSSFDVVSSPSYFYDDDGNAHETRRTVQTRLFGSVCKRQQTGSWNLNNCQCDNLPATSLTLGTEADHWDSSSARNLPARWVATSCPSGKTGSREVLQYFESRIGNSGKCTWKTPSHKVYRNDTCTCDNYPGYDTDVATVSCGGGFPGTLSQPLKFNHNSCKWVNDGPVTGTCSCDKDPLNPPTEKISCGSGLYQPGSHLVRKMKLNTKSCTWVSDGAGAITANNCVCQAAQSGTQDHSCADATCEVPDVPDQLSIPLTASPACALDKSSATVTTVGSCRPRGFFWDEVSSHGFADSRPSSPVLIDDGCTCAQKDTLAFCYEAGDSKRRYKCKCIPAE